MLVGLLASAKLPPAPLRILQVPVPIAGVLAARLAVGPQTIWFGPAAATVGAASNLIVTVDVLGAQTPLEIDHCKTYVVPAVPVKVDVGLEGVVTVPPNPLMIDQVPV